MAKRKITINGITGELRTNPEEFWYHLRNGANVSQMCVEPCRLERPALVSLVRSWEDQLASGNDMWRDYLGNDLITCGDCFYAVKHIAEVEGFPRVLAAILPRSVTGFRAAVDQAVAAGSLSISAIDQIVDGLEHIRACTPPDAIDDQLFAESYPRSIRQHLSQRARQRGYSQLADIMEARVNQTKAQAKARISRNFNAEARVSGISQSQADRDKDMFYNIIDEWYDPESDVQ